MYTDELECRKYVKKHTFRHVCLYICVDSPHDSRKKTTRNSHLKIPHLQGLILTYLWDRWNHAEQVMMVDFQRCVLQQEVLETQLRTFLTCTHELFQYVLLLRSFPCRAVCLTAPGTTEAVQEATLCAAKEEWCIVQQLEADVVAKQALMQHCSYTSFQCYREIMGALVKNRFVLTSEVKNTVDAWYPKWCQSSTLENIFREVEQAVKKAGPLQDSMSNMECVAVRALERRILSADNTPETVELTEADWAGKTTRGLKASLWNPAASTPRSFAAR